MHSSKTTTPNSPTFQLTEVRTNFEQWRLTRTKRGKIPDYLWQQVLALLDKHSIGEITTTLNLSGSYLKNKMKQFNCKAITPSKPHDFVAINVPPSIPKTIQHSVGKVEIKRADGTSISIENLENNTLTQILTQFMQGL